MTRILLLMVLFCADAAYGQNPKDSLTIEKIMQDPKWIGTSPSDIYWNYNGKSVYFKWNPEKSVSDSVYEYFLSTREIRKTSYAEGQRSRAIHDGVYDHGRNRIAYAYNDDIFLLSVANGNTQRITHSPGKKSVVGFSSHDNWVVYSISDNLYAWSISEGTNIQLTNFIRGNSPESPQRDRQDQWLAEEQLRTSDIIKERKNKKNLHDNYLKAIKEKDTLRNIYTGNRHPDNVQISPDGKFITYSLVVSPANIRQTHVTNYITESGYTGELIDRPKVGNPEDSSTLYVFDRSRDSLIKVSMDSLPGIFDPPAFLKEYPAPGKPNKPSPRNASVVLLSWNDAGSVAIADIRSTDNKDRWLAKLDPYSGRLAVIDHQHDEAWIAGPGIGWLGNPIMGWINNAEFYFQSEATGFSHPYICNTQSGEKKAITKGQFEVQDLVLSPDKKYFYMVANEDHPGKQQVYRIGVSGGVKEKITSMDGGYEFFLSPDEKHLALRYSYQNKPWELFIKDAGSNSKMEQVTNKAMSSEWSSYPWRDTKIFTFTARDGKPVYARIYEPEKSKKNNAAVIFVHGAGYLQNVDYRWSYYFREYMFNNLLADRGYTVLDIDYRASAGYGRDWRTGIYRHMGGKDLDDEIDAAKYLVRELGIDPARIGMYGGSYGGFMTLMALFTQPDIFKAGAALRPVTDWAHYNDGYTSAILNYPYNDSLAYQLSSPINFAAGLKNNLLICHGMVDVNVQFQDAVRLAQRLIELGKNNWELAVYPVEDHGFVEPSSWTDEYKRIFRLFETNLK